MNTNDTINAAISVAARIMESNSFVTAEDTVCALRTRYGNIFTGSSCSGRNAPGVMGGHAEIEAVQAMLASRETIIDELVLISIQSGIQILPCNNCAGYIMSLHQENANCRVLMPDRAIRLIDVGRFAFGGVIPDPTAFQGNGNFMYNGGMPSGNEYRAPQPYFDNNNTASIDTGHASGDLLKNRVSDLLKVTDDDDEEEEQKKSKPVKKKLFGLF